MSGPPPESVPEYDPNWDQPPAAPAYQPPPAYHPPPAPGPDGRPEPTPVPPRSGPRHLADSPPSKPHSMPVYGQPFDAQPMPAAPGSPGYSPYTGQPGYPAIPDYAAYADQTRRTVGIIGPILLVIGAALVVVSFTSLTWLKADAGLAADLQFSDLHDLVGNGSPKVPELYFGWLGWALLAGVVVLGLLASLPTRAHPLWRLLGLVAGLAGSIVTFYALYTDGTTLRNLYDFAGSGFWLAIGGFFVAAIGAVVGPRRTRT